MKNPAAIFPEAMQSILALGKVAETSGVPKSTLALVHLRSSQINGCSVCVDLALRFHQKEIGLERMMAVAAWRDAPYFDDAERAALALAECVTRLSDRSDPIPDDVWNEAAGHFDERQLAGLLLNIATTNVWNRLNSATRQIAGEWAKSLDAQKLHEKAEAHA